MQMITPIDIDDANMTSSVAEPDTSQGEIEWETREVPSEFGTISETPYCAVLANDGFIYCAGRADIITKIDPSTSTLSEITVGFSGICSAGVLGGDGNVYFFGATNGVMKLDVDTQTTSYITGVTQTQVEAAVLASDGCIYATGLMTGSSQPIVKLDVDAQTLETFLDIEVGDFYAGALGANGSMYFVGNAGFILKVNLDGTTEEFGTLSGTYFTANVSDSGGVYCVGTSSDGVLLIDVDEQSTSTFGGAIEGLETAVSALSGSIYCSGILGAVAKIDTSTNTLSYTSTGVYVQASAAGSDGYIFFTGVSFSNPVVVKFPPEYASGDQAISTTSHKLYQAVDNTTDDPIIGAELTPPSWVEVSATNKYRAFDYTINTVSTMTTSTAEITLTPGEICTTISLYGLGDISTVYIKVYDGSTSGTLLYDESQDLTINQPVEDSIVNDNYYRDKVMFDDLPATYSNPHIVITFDSDEDEIEVGDVVIGNARTMGAMVYESSTTRTSYDTVDTDDYGNETITSRPSAEYTTFELFVEPDYADYVERMLKSSLNKIRVYVGDKNSTEKLFTLGYYERSPITYDAPMKCSTTLKVRGLV